MTREEVNQALNELCQYGGMMLDGRYVEAIRIAAIFFETGEDTATKEKKRNCENCAKAWTDDCEEALCFGNNYCEWKPATKEGDGE